MLPDRTRQLLIDQLRSVINPTDHERARLLLALSEEVHSSTEDGGSGPPSPREYVPTPSTTGTESSPSPVSPSN